MLKFEKKSNIEPNYLKKYTQYFTTATNVANSQYIYLNFTVVIGTLYKLCISVQFSVIFYDFQIVKINQ